MLVLLEQEAEKQGIERLRIYRDQELIASLA